MIYISKKYGEFTCPYCHAIFFQHKKLQQHIGGKHKKDITQKQDPTCKFCNDKLTDTNWLPSMQKQRNLICTTCKRKQNREVYRNKLKKDMDINYQKLQAVKKRIKYDS